MAVGPLVLLSGGAGRTFIETGLVVIRDTRSRLFAKRPDRTERDVLNNITIHHEWIHYLQSFTCAAVHYAAQQMLQLAVDTVSAASTGAVPNETHARIRELTEELYGRRANEPVKIVDHPGATLMIPIPDSHRIGLLDLLEGVAVLESFKLCTANADVADFLAFRDRHFAGSEKSVYRWSFNWLADAIGPEAAYELLAPVSFFALQTDDPAAEFVRIVRILAAEEHLDSRGLSDVEALADLVYKGQWQSFLASFEEGEPSSGHATFDKCAAFAVGQLGARSVARLGATPSRVTAETFEALRPPVIAYSGDESVALDIPAYARSGLAEMVIDWTSIVGAAERLTIRADTGVYQFCPHGDCPHFESALCHRHFAPPGVNRRYEDCRFPAAFHQFARVQPRDGWARAGRERKTVAEIVAAFEATGEAGLWALARRQRASLVAWLGEDGYGDIEWKCKATADKALRALQTQKMDDLIEAKTFRAAVVAEIRRRAEAAH
jgi:hypothetical protein